MESLPQRIEWWMVIVDRGGPILKDVYDYNLAELFNLYRKTKAPEMQRLVKILRYRQLFP